MKNGSIKYYLETNAIYSLINKIDLFVDSVDVATSLYAYEELISGLNEQQYHRRKVLITKLKGSKLKIYPYLPIECIAIAFELDITSLQIIQEKKKLLLKKVNLIISSDNYSIYEKRLREIEDIEILEEKKIIDENEVIMANKLREMIKENHSDIKNLEKRQKIEPEYHEIDIMKAFGLVDEKPDYEYARQILIQMLKECKISYENADIDESVRRYDGRQLVAFNLGQMAYMWHRSYHMKPAGNNDISDLMHLLYLKDENYIIVSNDKIFANATLAKMRITCDDFLKIFEKTN